MRTHAEPIAVRLASGAGQSQPDRFIWRHRLWRVLAVQRHWVEAGCWWDDPRVRRARGQDTGPIDQSAGDLLAELHLWRVEAAAGSGPVGVYDLACQGRNWQLRAVCD